MLVTNNSATQEALHDVSYVPASEQAILPGSWGVELRRGANPLRNNRYHVLKRTMDVSLVILALPLLLPIFLICALLVKIESPGGPVLFVQKRTGKGGKRFDMYKFRTMVPNADELKEELAHLNELQPPDFKISEDPRVTRMGRFLRKSSLDELPQVINVLKGEMSLVGPRPTSFEPETYDLWHTERLDVIPGITGLWQVVGRGETEFDERLRLDIAYMEQGSLWFDLKILLRTVTVVLRGDGAH